LKKLGNFIYDHSKLIIAFVVIVNIASLISFFRFDLDTDFLAFFSKGNPKAESYTELSIKYSSGETISVLVEDDSSLLEEENLLDIFALQGDIGVISGVTRVQSFIPPEIMTAGGITPVNESYIEEQYADLRDFIDNEYFMTGQFLTDDRHTAVIIVGLGPNTEAGKVIDSLELLIEDSPLNLSLAGNEVIKDTIFGYLIRVLAMLPPFAIILVLLIFYLVLRKRRLTVLAIVPAGLAALWTFGTLFWSGQDLNLVTALTPIFILVIG